MTQNFFRWGLRQLLWSSVLSATVFGTACNNSPPASNTAPTKNESTNPRPDLSKAQDRSQGVCTDAILPEVRWLSANAALVVEPIGEHYWLARIAEGSPDPMIKFQRLSLPSDGRITPSPSGDSFALYDVVEDQISISTNLQDWIVTSSPPPLSHLFPDPLDRLKQERVQLYWMDNTTLVVQRSNFSSGNFACAAYNIVDKQWRQTDSCLDLGDTPGEPVTIAPVADSIFAVETSAEGVTGLSLLRMNGSAVTRIGELSLGNSVEAHVERYATPDATVITSHVLASGTAQLAPDRCWQLYTWNLADDSLRLLRKGLPRKTRLMPGKDNQWLWPTEQGELCLGDPDSSARCVALPNAQR